MSDAEEPRVGEGSDYAHVRERLVSMGYLARPLERYLLGGAARPGSFLRRHAAVSLRVAVAAGPLLGLLFALAVVVANRPRFSHVRDFLVLSAGFTLVFGAAIFVLELGAGILLAGFVRWRGRGVAAFPATAARAGFAVSLVMSAYLAFWWRRRAGPDASVGLDLAGLAVLALVNAALLRVSSLASLAALVRVSDLPAPASPGAKRGAAGAPAGDRRAFARGRLVAPGALATLLLIAGFFVAPRSRFADAPSPFTRLPAEGRLIVVACDGVPGDLLLPDHRGSTFPEFWGGIEWTMTPHRIRGPGTALPATPAALWTTVATGSAEHGVSAIEEKRPVGLSSPLEGRAPLASLLRTLLPGQRVAVSSGFRSRRTLWEIIGEKEGVGSVGWWATWPAIARGSAGVPFDIVSDRALFALRRPSVGDFLIAPAALERRLNAEYEGDLGRIAKDLRDHWITRFFWAGTPNRAAVPEELRRRVVQAATIDGYAMAVTAKLVEDPAVKDIFVYLPGLDISRMAFATQIAEKEPADHFVEGYNFYIGMQLRGLLAGLAREDTIVMITSPGRRGSELRGVPWGWMCVIRDGSRSRPAPSLEIEPDVEVSLLDITPTLLNLRGFPVSREMEGRSLVRFTDESRRPPTIDSYGRNALPAIPFSSSNEESERETLERLRSLGYLN